VSGPRLPWWRLVDRLLDRLDARVTPEIDARARAKGWTVERVAGTRTHVCRDPRFDRRHVCPLCFGSGCEGARPCPTCSGTGVVTDPPGEDTGPGLHELGAEEGTS
jgi:hypothetical protein